MSAKKPDLWMPLYIAKYLADTTRLTTEQHGAYLLLIMDYWVSGPPPDNNGTLAQITGLTPAKWRAVRSVLQPKFQVKDGLWHHKRVEHELSKAREMQATLSERGRAGAVARWAADDASSTATGNASGTATASATSNATGNPQAMPETMLADAPVPTPNTEVPSPSPLPTAHAPAHTRAGEIAVLLRTLAAMKGKTIRIASIDKKVTDWAANGVTDQQLTAAFDLALQDREAKHDATAIYPGFVDVFLVKLLNPHESGSRINGAARNIDWWSTADGVKAKALEQGIEPEGKDANWLKCAIAVKVGGDAWPWIDPRNGTLQRVIEEIRKNERRLS